MKYRKYSIIAESLIFSLLSTLAYGVIMYIVEKGNFNITGFIGLAVHAIIIFLSYVFFIRKKEIKK